MVEAVLAPPSSHSSNKSDSFDLVCACARVTPLPEQASLIASTDYSTLDWDDFLHLSEHHGVLPLVARNLLNYARALLPDTRQSLSSSYEANLRRNLWFASELVRILKHFEKRQVRSIAFKGPALAEPVYGDLGLRSFFDLDLLISPNDFPNTKHALAELGYFPSQELTPSVERFFLRIGYERSFDSSAGRNLLELQWSLLPYFYALNFESTGFTIDHLLKRAKPREICGYRLLCLSPEDSLLALCLHAAKHLWTRLIWIADIAQTLESEEIDVPLVISRAIALGIRRILAVSLLLSNRLLGTTIPAEALPLTKDDSEVSRCVDQAISRMAAATTYSLESGAYFKEIAKLRERPADRLRYLSRLVWTPSAGDIAALKLPETLFPLYRVVRVARLLRKVA